MKYWVFLAASFFLFCSSAVNAQGTSITVTSLADDGSSGTLREAITNANASSTITEINFLVSLSGTIALTDDLPNITRSFSIVGPGADKVTLSGEYNFKMFYVNENQTLTISGFTLTKNKAEKGSIFDVAFSSIIASEIVTTGMTGNFPFQALNGFEIKFTNSTFTQNSGPLFFSDYGNYTETTSANDADYTNRITIVNCLFSNNSNRIFELERYLKISGSTFINNTGLIVQFSGYNRIQILNSVFKNNNNLFSISADYKLGSFSNYHDLIRGNVFENNGTILSSGSTNVPYTTISKNIFYKNTEIWANTAAVFTDNLTVTGTIDPFNFSPGTASTAQSFSVSSSDLNDNVTITAPSGYEVSLALGSGYAGQIIIPNPGGELNSTTIFIRVKSDATGFPTGNLSITSSAANELAVEVNIQTILSTTYCTFGQGTYGNSGGTYPFTTYSNSGGIVTYTTVNVSTTQLLTHLLNKPLVIGASSRKFTIPSGSDGAKCIIAGLPAGSSISILPGTNSCSSMNGILLNKDKSFRNSLMGQAITLTLNIRRSVLSTPLTENQLGELRLTDACFSTPAGSFTIPQRVINFLGANNKVSDLLALGNKALAGQLTSANLNLVSLTEISNAMGAINEGFTICSAYNNTNCPTLALNETMTTMELPPVSELYVLAYPNPYFDRVSFKITSSVSGQGSLEVYNLLGQKVNTVFQGHVIAGMTKTIEYAVPAAHRTPMIYIFRVGDKMQTGKLLH
jgi:hypothetical protein